MCLGEIKKVRVVIFIFIKCTIFSGCEKGRPQFLWSLAEGFIKRCRGEILAQNQDRNRKILKGFSRSGLSQGGRTTISISCSQFLSSPSLYTYSLSFNFFTLLISLIISLYLLNKFLNCLLSLNSLFTPSREPINPYN